MDTLKLPSLNFLENYKFRFKKGQNGVFVFCVIRKKWLVLTPEEWVRQNWIQALIITQGFKRTALAVEYSLILNGTQKRADIVVFEKQNPKIIVECKAPKMVLNAKVIEQIHRYHKVLNAQYLVISNGVNHLIYQKNNHNFTPILKLPVNQ